jgi:hypothetical protein
MLQRISYVKHAAYRNNTFSKVAVGRTQPRCYFRVLHFHRIMLQPHTIILKDYQLHKPVCEGHMLLVKYRATKNNAEVSRTCSLGTKTDLRVLFAVFYSYTEIAFIHMCIRFQVTKRFTMRDIYISTDIPSRVHLLPLALYHVLFNIRDCCSGPCFELIQGIHSLAVRLVFH